MGSGALGDSNPKHLFYIYMMQCTCNLLCQQTNVQIATKRVYNNDRKLMEDLKLIQKIIHVCRQFCSIHIYVRMYVLPLVAS